MNDLPAWLGDLNGIEELNSAVVGLLCIAASIAAGTLVGIERERRDKPAGLRTLILICVGSTIFTIVSIIVSRSKPMADPARIAAQVIPGVGFLGAGAIIHARGVVVGLTTGATIWAVAAVGVTIGAGYVVAGLVFAVLIYLTLTAVQHIERLVVGRCETRKVVVFYEPDGGKARHRLQALLDQFEIPDDSVEEGLTATKESYLTFSPCVAHRDHRGILKLLADEPSVRSIDYEGAEASASASTPTPTPTSTSS